MKNVKSISIMFPLYNDRRTVKKMIYKSISVLQKLKKKYELVIVDDGCPEKSGFWQRRLQKKISSSKLSYIRKILVMDQR